MSDASQPIVCGLKCGFMVDGPARRDAYRGPGELCSWGRDGAEEINGGGDSSLLKYTAEESKQMRAFLIVARQSSILILAKITAKTRQKKFGNVPDVRATGGNEIFGSG